MGLDLLDIRFRLEKGFGIVLSNEDFSALVRNGDITVGDLYNLLLKKMNLRDVARYDIGLNYRLWEEIQGILQSVTSVPRTGGTPGVFGGRGSSVTSTAPLRRIRSLKVSRPVPSGESNSPP